MLVRYTQKLYVPHIHTIYESSPPYHIIDSIILPLTGGNKVQFVITDPWSLAIWCHRHILKPFSAAAAAAESRYSKWTVVSLPNIAKHTTSCVAPSCYHTHINVMVGTTTRWCITPPHICTYAYLNGHIFELLRGGGFVDMATNCAQFECGHINRARISLSTTMSTVTAEYRARVWECLSASSSRLPPPGH